MKGRLATSFGILLLCYVLLSMGFWVTDDKKPIPSAHPLDNPTPDSTREVQEFDWETNQYVYKDQLPENNGYPKKPFKYTTPEPYPDFFVKPSGRMVEDQDQFSTSDEDIVTIDGKRYRVWTKSNGEKQLIKLR